jgi:hypothetical protein
MTKTQLLTLIAAAAIQNQFEKRSAAANKAWVTRHAAKAAADAKAEQKRRNYSNGAKKAHKTRRLNKLSLYYGFPVGRAN